MLIKRIISTVTVMGVMAAFAVAGSPGFASGKKPAEVTVYGNYTRSAPTEDKFIPGPDPVEGVAEGFYFAGKGVAEGVLEVTDGIGQSGGKLADDAVDLRSSRSWYQVRSRVPVASAKAPFAA